MANTKMITISVGVCPDCQGIGELYQSGHGEPSCFACRGKAKEEKPAEPTAEIVEKKKG